MNILKLIGRDNNLFDNDIFNKEQEIRDIIEGSKCLVLGAAGTIGQALTKELFLRNPKKLYAVDINENNLVELVRDLRSTKGYIKGDFKTFVIDVGSEIFQQFFKSTAPFDYIFNITALKHVRSEKDQFTLMRMLEVNILNNLKILKIAQDNKVKKYFCISTDKAANPINLMGASKKIMELFVMRESSKIQISMSRFANVAFSDGSLLQGFNNRFQKKQPFSSPLDIKRYFITPKESGQLCLISGLFGNNREILFPKLNNKFMPQNFSDIASRYLRFHGYEPYLCKSENEARLAVELIKEKKWPCFFFNSDTTGEKDIEEFYTKYEEIDLFKFKEIGVIKNKQIMKSVKLDNFITNYYKLLKTENRNKIDIINLIKNTLDNFIHYEKNKYLDEKM